MQPTASTHTEPDPTEIQARALYGVLAERGVTNFLHWDRSPWGVRIPLTDDTDEFAPALFVMTEGTQRGVLGHDVWAWFGVLGGLAGLENLTDGLTLRWAECESQSVQAVADLLVPLVSLLRIGVGAALAHELPTRLPEQDDDLTAVAEAAGVYAVHAQARPGRDGFEADATPTVSILSAARRRRR